MYLHGQISLKLIQPDDSVNIVNEPFHLLCLLPGYARPSDELDEAIDGELNIKRDLGHLIIIV